jgi:hypothetical protein
VHGGELFDQLISKDSAPCNLAVRLGCSVVRFLRCVKDPKHR